MATRHGSSDSETSESYEVLQSRKEEPEEKRRRTNSADKIQDGSHRVHQRDNVQSGWMYDSQCCSNCGAVKIIWQYQAICHLCNHIAYDAPVPDPRSELKELLDNFIKEHPTLSVQDAFEIILCKMLQGKQRHPLPPERMSIMANLVGNMLQLIAGTVSSLEATGSEHGTGKGGKRMDEDESVQGYLASSGFWSRDLICTMQAGNLDRGDRLNEGIPLDAILAAEKLDQTTAEERRNDEIARDIEEESYQEQALVQYNLQCFREMHEP